MHTHRLMITAARGGVGKSTIAAGISLALAARGARVVLVDLDLSERSLDMLLGCEDRVVYDLGDLLAGRREVTGVSLPLLDFAGCYLIPGVFHLSGVPSRDSLVACLSQIEAELRPDIVVLDTSSPADPSVAAGAAFSDLTLAVTQTDPLSLRSLGALSPALISWGARDVRFLVNRFPCTTASTDLRALIDLLRIPLFGLIPEDAHLSLDPASAFLRACSNLALRLRGENIPLLAGLVRDRRQILCV